MEWVLVWFVFSIVVGGVAVGKGRNPLGWFLLSILISPLLGILALIAVPNLKPEHARIQELRTSKKCPFCAEYVKQDAVVCRFCGRDISDAEHPKNENLPPSTAQPVVELGGPMPVAPSRQPPIFWPITIAVAILASGYGAAYWYDQTFRTAEPAASNSVSSKTNSAPQDTTLSSVEVNQPPAAPQTAAPAARRDTVLVAPVLPSRGDIVAAERAKSEKQASLPQGQRVTIVPGTVDLTPKLRGDMERFLRAGNFTCPRVQSIGKYGTEVWCAKEPFNRDTDPIYR